jgi:hypothetical protein
MISTLAYSTIGFSMRQNSAREEALLARARDFHTANLFGHLRGAAARHRFVPQDARRFPVQTQRSRVAETVRT